MDDTTYLSWAITNTGPSDVDQVFFVDLYIDDVFVQRWRGSGVQADRVRFIDSWIGLEIRVRPGPGSHTLKVIVDSTDLVPELDESDNTFEREFVWEESKLAEVTPTPLPERLPDITVFTPKGWEAPLLATSYPGDTRDGPLSVDVPTFVNFGIANNGPASTPEFVWVYLYIDDVLIDNVSWDGLLAYRSSEVVGRDNILEIISLAPGVHTLRVVVDATNRVVESDESNNVLEREFTWGSGPVPPKPIALPTPEPTPPAPLVLPNLVPGWRFGWDSPIIVSHESESFLDNPLSVNDKAYVTVVVQNQSIIRASQTFDVDLYFDGEKVNTTEFTGETEAAFLRWKVWENLNDQVQITPGAHTLKIVIDAENSVEEANENDNVYKKTLVWAAEGPVAAKPVFYTDEELQQKLLGLWTLLDTRESVISEDRPDLAERVFNIADAAYYLVTGTSIWNERVAIFLLSHGDYLNWIDDSFFRKFALNEASEYPEILAARERFKRISLGFKTRRFWKVAIVVDADNDPARVLNSLAHGWGTCVRIS